MPRASWRGFLRLSLVSCPIYLSPATTRTKSIRLHQVWQATPADEADEVPDRGQEQDVPTDRQRGSGLTAHRSAPRAYPMFHRPIIRAAFGLPFSFSNAVPSLLRHV